MSSFTRSLLAIFAVASLVGASLSACGSTVQTQPKQTTSTSSSGGGGAGAAGGAGASGGVGASGASGGMGATGGTGGTPVIVNTGTDQCPGDPYTLTAGGAPLLLAGDTSDAVDDYQAPVCAGETPPGTSGPDRVYFFQITDPGSTRVTVEAVSGSLLQPSMYLRCAGGGSDCLDPEGGTGGAGGGTSAACSDNSETDGAWCFFNGPESFARHFNPTSFYLFVDGKGGTSGEYRLTVEHDPPACGDGVLNPATEECDDGNTIDDDGCSNICEFVYISLFDNCPGESVILTAGKLADSISGSTTPYTDSYQSSAGGNCAENGLVGGKDRVHQVQVGVSGTLVANVGYNSNGPPPGGVDICATYGTAHAGCWDRVLYAVGPSVCGNPSPNGGTPSLQLDCSDQGPEAAEQISFPVTAGEVYYIIVDGYWCNPGTCSDVFYGEYSLNLTLTPS